MFNFEIAGITPRDIENHNKTFNFNVKELFTGGGGGTGGTGRLTTTGECWFDVPYRANLDSEFRITFTHTNTSNKYVFSDNTYIRLLVPNGSNIFGKSWSFSCQTNANERTTIILNKDSITCNGVTKTIGATSTFTSKTNLTLWAYSAGGSSSFEGSCEMFQIYEAGQLVLDWRPHKDEAGVACFKDTVTGTNHYKLGTGTLTFEE